MAKTENLELKEILRRTDRLLLNDYKYGTEKEVLLEEDLNEAHPLGHPPGYPDTTQIKASLAQLKKRDAANLLDKIPGKGNEYPSIRKHPDDYEMDETMDEMHDEMDVAHWNCPGCGCEDNTSTECPQCGYEHGSAEYGMEEMEEGAAHYEDLYSKFLAEEGKDDSDEDDKDDDADDDSKEVDEMEDDSDDSGKKKTNGHKADCECPLCKNLKEEAIDEATDEHNINAPKHHKTGTPLETDAGDNKANKNRADMARKGGKRALKPSARGKAVLAKGTVNAVSESEELAEFAKSEEPEADAATSTHMSQEEMGQLRWMLNLLGKTKEYSYARRVYEKVRAGQAITVPQEKKVLGEMIELFMRADKGALRIFLNRLK